MRGVNNIMPGGMLVRKILQFRSLRTMGIYTFTNFFGKAISFLLLFIFTDPRFISPSENGLLSLFSTGMLFLMPFLSMGLLHSTSTDFFRMEKSEFRNFFTTGFVMAFTVMCISCCALYFFREQIAHLYGYPAQFCWLIPLITFLTFCNEQFLSLVRNNNQPLIYLKANCVRILSELGISVLLVVSFAWRWEGRVAGILLGFMVTAVYGGWYFFRNGYLFGRISRRFVLSELRFAVPVIIMQLSIFCMGASDKFFLSAFSADNNETVGIYGVATVFASVIIVLSTALIQYVFPKIYQNLSAAQPDFTAIRKLFLLYFFIMLAGTVFLAAATPFAYRMCVNEKYFPAMKYIYLLFASYFTWAIVYFFYSFLLYFKQRRKLIILSFASMGISLSFNYIFIKEYGDFGAAVSLLATYLLVLFITLTVTRVYWKQFLKP